MYRRNLAYDVYGMYYEANDVRNYELPNLVKKAVISVRSSGRSFLGRSKRVQGTLIQLVWRSADSLVGSAEKFGVF